MEDSPARNTRNASRLKIQGQSEDKERHYRSKSCVNLKVRSEHNNIRIRSPSSDSIDVKRLRHTSREEIQQGKVGNLCNQIEGIRCKTKEGTLLSSELGYGSQLLNVSVNSSLCEVRCRLFGKDDTPEKGTAVQIQCVKVTDERTHGEQNTVVTLMTVKGVMLGDGQKQTFVNRHEIATGAGVGVGVNSDNQLNSNSKEGTLTDGTLTDDAIRNVDLKGSKESDIHTTDSGEEVELVINQDRVSRDPKMSKLQDPRRKMEEEEIVVPENVMIVDLYKMLARLQLQMGTIPTSLSNLEMTVEDLNSWLKTQDTDPRWTQHLPIYRWDKQ